MVIGVGSEKTAIRENEKKRIEARGFMVIVVENGVFLSLVLFWLVLS